MSPTVISVIKGLLGGWTTTPVQWANDRPDRPEPPAPWVFAEIRGVDSRLLSMGTVGNHQMQDDGFVSLSVFVPFGTGTDLAYQYSEQLAALFRGVAQSGVQFLAPTPADGGPGSDDGNWYRVTTHIPFFYLYIG